MKYDIDIRCERGNKLVRSNENGMFCSKKNCECEKESEKLAPIMKDFIKMLSEAFPLRKG